MADNSMLSDLTAATTLLDLPDDLLSSCLPWEGDQAETLRRIRSCMAVCKRMLGICLKGGSNGRVGLQLHMDKLHDIPVRRATLQLVAKAFPDLHRLHISHWGAVHDVSAPLLTAPEDDEEHDAGSLMGLNLSEAFPNLHKLHIKIPKGGLRDFVAPLLVGVEGIQKSDAGWLSGITHMCLLGAPADVIQNPRICLPHLVHAGVATACPNLMELNLRGIILSEQCQQSLDEEWRKQWNEVTEAVKNAELELSRLEQHFQQLDSTDGIGITMGHMLALRAMVRNRILGIEALGPLVPKDALKGQSAQPARLEHLQQLKLHRCDVCNSAAAFKQQLQQLPSLQEISLLGCRFREGAVQQEYAVAVADSCSGQLVHIEWDCLLKQGMLSLLSKPYAHLQQLTVPSIRICDPVMKLLLQHAPSVSRLLVEGFFLEQDFSHRQCSWDTVILNSSIHVFSLARMPLSRKPKLCAGHDVFVLLGRERGVAAGDLQLTAAAAAAVARCGGIQACKSTLSRSVAIEVAMGALPHVGEVLLATLPVFSSIARSLELSFVHVTRTLLKAISHLPHCERLMIREGCTFEEGIWGSMIDRLPNISTLLVGSDAATLNQLMVLCAMATHPITLMLRAGQFDDEDEVDDEVDEEDQQHAWHNVLQQAVTDAGHTYVNFMFLGHDY